MTDQDLGFDIREIVLAVKDVDAASEHLAKVLQSERDENIVHPDYDANLEMSGVWAGDFRIALITDRSDDGPMARFIKNRGEGLYEVCLRTNDIEAAIKHMKGLGIKFQSEEPHVIRNYEWRGEIFSELRIVFLDPSTTYGLLIELGQWVK